MATATTRPATCNMNEFLQAMQTLAKNDPQRTVTYVMSNSACDLDSAISTLVYSYFNYWKVCALAVSMHSHRLFIPIINIKRSDFCLKTEVLYYLSKHDVNLDLLLFRDDINLQEQLSMTRSNLILVDHHILNNEDSNLKDYVVAIYDHRPIDKSKWTYDKTKVNWTITGVASCTTLICSEIIAAGTLFFEENLQSAFLLYGTILLDSINLDPSAGRAKPLDFEMVSVLEQVLNIERPQEYRAELYLTIVKAKSDVSGLTPLQLLNKDVKSVGDILIPSLPLSAQEFLNMENSTLAIDDFLSNKEFKICIILGIKYAEGGIFRDIAIYYEKPNHIAETLIARLLTNSDPALGLTALTTPHKNMYVFKQNNIKASRKQILPIVTDVYAKAL